MSKGQVLSLDQAEALTERDDRYWFEGWTLCHFTPGRGGGIIFKRNAYFNRKWRSKNKWGFLKRIEVNSQGQYVL